ncbi:MAG: MBL fold metallo-hydrolase [Thioalkalivibrionaceae bacterium]
MLRFSAIGSGSNGNGVLVEAGATRVLIDCGFTVQETIRRLLRLGVEAESLDAIVITHEHQDHIGSSPAFARRFGTPVHLTAGTRLAARDARFPTVNEIADGIKFAIGELEFTPFTVPHDAREPVQFVISDGAARLGLLTDAGHITPYIEQTLTNVDALLLECNHDPDLLATGPYPPSLKRRVGGGHGHLPNHAAATLLGRINFRRLQHCVGMHLSEKNNQPQLARAALATGLGCEARDAELACQHHGIDWRTVTGTPSG